MKHEHNHSQETESRFWDGLGMALSGLCAIHCLALPLGTVLLIPAMEHMPNEHAFHWIMALIIFPIGSVAFWRGYIRHQSKRVVVLGILGLALIWIGILSGSIEIAHNEFPVTLIGSTALIIAHYKNWQLSRCSSCKSHSTSPQGTEPVHS